MTSDELAMQNGPVEALVHAWRARAEEIREDIRASGEAAPVMLAIAEELLIRSDDLEHALQQASERAASAPLDSCRRIYPADGDAGAVRVELSPQGVSTVGIALVVTDDPKYGERERPVRIVMTKPQAVGLLARLRALVDEM